MIFDTLEQFYICLTAMLGKESFGILLLLTWKFDAISYL